ncbi:MAG: hypothetical protein ACHP8A_13015 [Terriglobales bacterium]|jgi:hypothetical protein
MERPAFPPDRTGEDARLSIERKKVLSRALRVTPAMEAGLSDHVWGLAELTALLDTALTIAA